MYVSAYVLVCNINFFSVYYCVGYIYISFMYIYIILVYILSLHIYCVMYMSAYVCTGVFSFIELSLYEVD